MTGALVLSARAANVALVPPWVPAAVGGIGSALAAAFLIGRPGRRGD